MAQASEQMTMALINDAERWVVKKLETYALDELYAIISAHAKNASISATNVAAAESYAAVAAVAAASAMAGIPIVGPGAAEAAAVGMETTMQGYVAAASYDTGGIIPRDGIIMAHEKESVLPAHLTEFLMDAAGRGNQSGQPSHGIRDINFSPTYHTTGNAGQASVRDFAKVLRRANLIT